MDRYNDEDFLSVGDIVETELDGIGTVEGEIVYITDKDDLILKSKRSHGIYDISKESLVKRFADFNYNGSTRGICFFIVTDGSNSLNEFYNNYPEKTNKVTSLKNDYRPLSDTGLEKLRECVHSFLMQRGYDYKYIDKFENIRKGKSGLRSFYNEFNRFNFGFSQEHFMQIIKRAIMTEQMDRLMKEENRRILEFRKNNKRLL